MNVEEITSVIMNHFKRATDRPGYCESQGKFLEYLNQEDQQLLPDAISLLETQGFIKCEKNPKNSNGNILELTKEGYRAINGKDYVPNTDPDNCPCQK